MFGRGGFLIGVVFIPGSDLTATLRNLPHRLTHRSSFFTSAISIAGGYDFLSMSSSAIPSSSSSIVTFILHLGRRRLDRDLSLTQRLLRYSLYLHHCPRLSRV
ncbi:unnamed protein product [Trifolium pratense]|uniref:Uncharacterized protein n=1 Tax=Trifolium pratense TaxID=57577 RepID=A0ACB0IZ93_TRIPR|nr:unnamed protein product [Trifolium pratense]